MKSSSANNAKKIRNPEKSPVRMTRRAAAAAAAAAAEGNGCDTSMSGEESVNTALNDASTSTLELPQSPPQSGLNPMEVAVHHMKSSMDFFIQKIALVEEAVKAEKEKAEKMRRNHQEQLEISTKKAEELKQELLLVKKQAAEKDKKKSDCNQILYQKVSELTKENRDLKAQLKLKQKRKSSTAAAKFSVDFFGKNNDIADESNGDGKMLKSVKSSTMTMMTMAKTSSHILEEVSTSIRSLSSFVECPICLETMVETHVSPECQHRFCGNCFKESLRKCNNECPQCRVGIPTRRYLRPDGAFDELVDALKHVLKHDENGALHEMVKLARDEGVEEAANGALEDMVKMAQYEGIENTLQIASENSRKSELEVSGKKNRTILEQEKIVSCTRISSDPYSTITCLDDESQSDDEEDVTNFTFDTDISINVSAESEESGTTLAHNSNSKENNTSRLRDKTRTSGKMVSDDGPESDNDELPLIEKRATITGRKSIQSTSTSAHSNADAEVQKDTDRIKAGLKRRSIRRKRSCRTKDGRTPKRVGLVERMSLQTTRRMLPVASNITASLANNDEDSLGDSNLSNGSDRLSDISVSKTAGDANIVDLTLFDEDSDDSDSDSDNEVEVIEPKLTIAGDGVESNRKRPLELDQSDKLIDERAESTNVSTNLLLDQPTFSSTNINNINDVMSQRIGRKKDKVQQHFNSVPPISQRLDINACQDNRETTDRQVTGISKRALRLGSSDGDSKSVKRSRSTHKKQIVSGSSSKQKEPNSIGKMQIDDDGEICLGTRINLHSRVRWIRHPFRSKQQWLPGFVYRDMEELLGDSVTSTCQSFHAFLNDRVSILSSMHENEKHVFGLAFDGQIYNIFMLPSDSFLIPDGLKLRPFSDTSIYDDLDLTDVNGGFLSAVKMIHGMLN